MPLNLPFTAGRTDDPKLYEMLRAIQQGALKSQDLAAASPITITRGPSGTPLTFGFGSGLPLGTQYGGTGASGPWTPGSVFFAGATGNFAQDNANFFWDNTNNRLGIGTTAPASRFDLVGSNTAGTTQSGTATFTNGSATVTRVTGTAWTTALIGNEIADTSTFGTPNHLINNVTFPAGVDTITLNKAWVGTTGTKNYTINIRNNLGRITAFNGDKANGLYMKVGDASDTYGIYMDTQATALDASAAINISNWGLGDSIHLGIESPPTGTPTPTGIGIDVNRSNYGSFAGVGVNVQNWQTSGGSGYGYLIVATNQPGCYTPAVYLTTDSQAVLCNPAASSYPAGATVIHVKSGTGFTGSDLFRVDGTGTVGALQPRANATNSAVQSIGNAAFTSFTFDTNTSVTQAVHSTSTNTSRFTVPTGGAGWYLCIGSYGLTATAGGAVRQIRILKNNATQLAQTTVLPNAAAGMTIQCSWQGDLADGDYVEFQGYQDSGGAVNTIAGVGNTFGSICKLW